MATTTKTKPRVTRRKCRKCDKWMADPPTASAPLLAAEKPNESYCVGCVAEQKTPDRYIFSRSPGSAPDGGDRWIVGWFTLGKTHGIHKFTRKEDAEEWLERAHAALLDGTFVNEVGRYVTPKKDCPTCAGHGWVDARSEVTTP